jgi:hypothetical protein
MNVKETASALENDWQRLEFSCVFWLPQDTNFARPQQLPIAARSPDSRRTADRAIPEMIDLGFSDAIRISAGLRHLAGLIIGGAFFGRK